MEREVATHSPSYFPENFWGFCQKEKRSWKCVVSKTELIFKTPYFKFLIATQ